MNTFDTIKKTFFDSITTLYPQIPSDHAYTFEINVDESKKQFGDISSNAALIIAYLTPLYFDNTFADVVESGTVGKRSLNVFRRA